MRFLHAFPVEKLPLFLSTKKKKSRKMSKSARGRNKIFEYDGVEWEGKKN